VYINEWPLSGIRSSQEQGYIKPEMGISATGLSRVYREKTKVLVSPTARIARVCTFPHSTVIDYTLRKPGKSSTKMDINRTLILISGFRH
jgi:hypothetical protein